jgi:hypothetical protein
MLDRVRCQVNLGLSSGLGTGLACAHTVENWVGERMAGPCAVKRIKKEKKPGPTRKMGQRGEEAQESFEVEKSFSIFKTFHKL